MSDPIKEAKRLLDETNIVLVDDDPAIKAVAAALAARDNEIAELKAALDSVSFPDRRWK